MDSTFVSSRLFQLAQFAHRCHRYNLGPGRIISVAARSARLCFFGVWTFFHLLNLYIYCRLIIYDIATAYPFALFVDHTI